MSDQATHIDAASIDRESRMAWWHEAKFGMFVHWGCYSVLGRGEQVLLRDFMPLNEYQPIADKFQPAADEDWTTIFRGYVLT